MERHYVVPRLAGLELSDERYDQLRGEDDDLLAIEDAQAQGYMSGLVVGALLTAGAFFLWGKMRK